MYRHRRKFKAQRPFRGLLGPLWMIGLGFLFLTGWWWPGILILVGISMVLEGVFAGFSPTVFDDVERPEFTPPQPPPVPPRPVDPPLAPFTQTVSAPEIHPFELLPANCPSCGGPVRRNDVQWKGARLAVCAYCGSGLPLNKKA